ncbi:MAG: glycosyltransferase family 4 protein [Ignavibacteria bacterium]|nr:glycosyltransferase family 4 protein [Ignavibacteria bacterium]
MKVVYLTSESYIDHSYTVAGELGKHIELNIFLQAKEATIEIDRWCKKFGAEFIQRRRFRNPLSFMSEIFFLLRIRKMKPDVVWFNTMTVYQVLLAGILLRKFLVVMHDVDLHPEIKDKHGMFSVKMTMKLALKKICAASKVQSEIFKQQHGFSPPVFQLPVIDYYKETGETAEKNSLEKNLSGKVRFFFFGSVEKYKGIETLLDAAGILQNKGLDFELNIYGRIKYDKEAILDRIRNIVNASIHDEFIDYRKIHQIYNSNDVLILPYRQVTQCGPLLIGYSEGVPSICSDLAGFREYINDGIDSIIFDNAAAGLAVKMEEIIKDPAIINKLSNGIEEVAMKKFSMAALAGDYIKNFKKCMAS